MFIWSLHPLIIAFVIFSIDFGALFILSKIFNNDQRNYKFLTYWIGDSLILPVYGFLSWTILNQVNIASTFLVNPLSIILIILLGYSLDVFAEFLSFHNKRHAVQDYREPTWWYHLLISGPMVLLIAGPLPIVLTFPEYLIIKIAIISCIFLFLYLIYLDFYPQKGKTAEKA